jgi:hypothetical protein
MALFEFTAPTRCPSCCENLKVAEGNREPEEGDLSVCTFCARFLVYKQLNADQLTLRLLTGEAFEELPERHQANLLQERGKVIEQQAKWYRDSKRCEGSVLN